MKSIKLWREPFFRRRYTCVRGHAKEPWIGGRVGIALPNSAIGGDHSFTEERAPLDDALLVFVGRDPHAALGSRTDFAASGRAVRFERFHTRRRRSEEGARTG